MQTLFWIAIGVNALNIFLDAALIIGIGPIPAMGIADAVAASSMSRWMGSPRPRRIGFTTGLRVSDAKRLTRVGVILFIRTGMLNIGDGNHLFMRPFFSVLLVPSFIVPITPVSG